MDLIAFVRARLDEDEAAANEAAGLDWHADNTALTVFTRQQVTGDRPGVRGIAWCSNGYGDDGANVYHIARHDPARALREVEAKRAILAPYAEVAYMDIADPEPEFAYGRAAGLGEAVRQLAAIWSDHPDYRQEWRV